MAQGATDNPAYSEPLGPIPVRDRRPYNLLFLQFTPETGDVLRRHAERFDLQLDIANNLLIPSPTAGATVIEDNEVQRLGFTWRRGIGHGVEVGVESALLWRNGGFLDPLLSAYHSLFGLQGNGPDNPAGRDAYSKYRSLLLLQDPQGNTLVNQGNAFGLGETTLTVKRRLIPVQRRSALALRFALKLPTGNPTLLLGSGSVDAGLSLDYRYSIGRDIVLYANAGGALMGKAVRVPDAEPSMFQGFAGIEYHPNHRDSFVLQVDGSSLVVRTGNSVADRVATTATFGYKRLLDRSHTLTVSFSENGDIHNYSLPYFSNIGPDFTVTANLEWRR
ncbi:MAG: hypothetical protein JWL77_1572 [Chthonomonadaceae bacterium]|nr:hypothetical protein [Chthonomonadaceae bacterium]